MRLQYSKESLKSYLNLSYEENSLRTWFNYIYGLDASGDNFDKNGSLSTYLNLIGSNSFRRNLQFIKPIFKKYIYKKRYAVVMCVVSSIALTDGQIFRLKEKVMNRYNVKNVFTVRSVDTSLIAGMIIRIQDSILDESLKNKIRMSLRSKINVV